MASHKFQCFQCGTLNSFVAPLGRREECTKCHCDAHVCKNCEHFDPKVYNECRETQADFVQERERANFCDYFQVRGQLNNMKQSANDLMAAAESLFKPKPKGED